MFDVPFSAGTIVFFLLLSLGASIVNGGLGYGYSSISIPLAILVLASRIVNPAYVLLELLINIVVFIFVGRKNIAATTKRCLPVILALAPGVVAGSLLLNWAAPVWIRFLAYTILLPLIFLQLAGFKRPIKAEAKASAPLGFGTGMLYSLTTISGPPLAVFWNNQGLTKQEFKATIAQIRVAESSFTVVSYYLLGLFSLGTTGPLFSIIAPPVLLGIPIGMYVVKKLSVETFRKIAMNFDALIVGYGLSRTLGPLFGVPEWISYAFWFAVIAIDLTLIYRFMRERKAVEENRIDIPLQKSQ
ncbi:MAG: sulfite exporter TauE/SafE family protein [Nitrososphaerales archaeon]